MRAWIENSSQLGEQSIASLISHKAHQHFSRLDKVHCTNSFVTKDTNLIPCVQSQYEQGNVSLRRHCAGKMWALSIQKNDTGLSADKLMWPWGLYHKWTGFIKDIFMGCCSASRQLADMLQASGSISNFYVTSWLTHCLTLGVSGTDQKKETDGFSQEMSFILDMVIPDGYEQPSLACSLIFA